MSKLFGQSLKLVKEQKAFLAFVFLATSFFITQHAWMPNPWDFHVYIMNGEYWFKGKKFFELMRPPLMPFITGVLCLISRQFSEYAYLVFASGFFAYASARVAKVLNFKSTQYFLILCSYFVLNRGLNDGTELLQFSFLEFYFCALLENKNSGHWFGLMLLSRYNSLALTPLLFFRGRKCWQDGVLFFLVLIPWLVYCQVQHGNAFVSFVELYENNILLRQADPQPWNAKHFIELIGLCFPLMLWGMGNQFVNRANLFSRKNMILIALVILALIGYGKTPFKASRYLFTLALPVSVFSMDGILYFKKVVREKTITIILALLFLINLSAAFHELYDGRGTQNIYRLAIADLRARGLNDCELESNNWVELSYEGYFTKPNSPREDLERKIAGGSLVADFPWIKEPEFMSDPNWINRQLILSKTNSYILFGKNCTKSL